MNDVESASNELRCRNTLNFFIGLRWWLRVVVCLVVDGHQVGRMNPRKAPTKCDQVDVFSIGAVLITIVKEFGSIHSEEDSPS